MKIEFVSLHHNFEHNFSIFLKKNRHQIFALVKLGIKNDISYLNIPINQNLNLLQDCKLLKW